MRTFDEIAADISAALPIGDVSSLRILAEEMMSLNVPEAEAAAENALGSVDRLTANYKSSIDHLQRALAIQQELANDRAVAVLQGNLANVYADIGEYTMAIQCYQQALTKHEDDNDRASIARVHGNMASVYRRLGDHHIALECNYKALSLYKELNDRVGTGVVYGNLGNVHTNLGDNVTALEYYHRALEIFAEFGDRISEARTTISVGALYGLTGDYARAMERYRQAMAFYEEFKNDAGVAVVLSSIGNIYGRIGDYSKAIDHLHRSLELHDRIGERASVAMVNSNIGVVYNHIGDNAKAFEYHHRALEQYTALGERAGMARVIGNIGNNLKSEGDHASALEHYRRTLAIYEEIGDKTSITHWTGSAISTMIDHGSIDEAAALLDKQAEMEMSDPIVRIEHSMNRGRLAELRSDVDEAKECLLEALEIATSKGLRKDMAECNLRLRDLAQIRNDFAAYIEHNNEYTKITEEIRGRETLQRLAMMDADRKAESIERERERERALLYGALPQAIATRMLRGEDVSGDHFENASVLFMDIAGFTSISDRLPPDQVVHLLKSIFRVCDDACKAHGLNKIKTIGDSYLAVGGVPEPLDDHAHRTAMAAIEILHQLRSLDIATDPPIGEVNVRIGLHCGPLVAGIVGDERLQYDVWGDTVNVASRMESTGEPGRIHVSEAFASFLADARNDSSPLVTNGEGTVIPRAKSEERGDSSQIPVPWSLRERGAIEIKGKGSMTTYWLEPTTATTHT